MAISEDFKSILELYNQEVKSSGVSIVSFYQQNGIVYFQFEHWYKNRKKIKVHPVKIVDKNGLSSNQSNESNTEPASVASDSRLASDTPKKNVTSSTVRFSVTIRTSSGLSIQHSHLDYHQLHALVEKLEVLC